MHMFTDTSTMKLRNAQLVIPQHLKLLQVPQAATSIAYSRTNPSQTRHPPESATFRISSTSAGFTVRSFQHADSRSSSVYSTTTRFATPLLSTPTSKLIVTSSAIHQSLTCQPTGARMQPNQPIVHLTLLFLPTSSSSGPTTLKQQQRQHKTTIETPSITLSTLSSCRSSSPRMFFASFRRYIYTFSITFPALCRSEPHHIPSKRQRSTFTIQNLSLVGGMTPLRLPQLTTGQ